MEAERVAAEHAALVAERDASIAQLKEEGANRAAAHTAMLWKKNAALEKLRNKAKLDAAASAGRLWSRTATTAVTISKAEASIARPTPQFTPHPVHYALAMQLVPSAPAMY